MNKLQQLLKNNKTLTFALLISLLFHLIVLSQFLIKLPAPKNLRNTFDVQLISGHPDKHIVKQSSSTENNTNIQQTLPENKLVEAPIKNSNTKPPTKPEEEFNPTKAFETQEDPSIKQQIVAEPTEPFQTKPPVISPTETPQPLKYSQTESHDPQQPNTQIKAQSMPAQPPMPVNLAHETIADLPSQANGNSFGDKSYKQIETEFEIVESNSPSTINISRVSFSTRGGKSSRETYVITQSLGADPTTTPNVSEGRITPNGLKPNFFAANGKYVNFAWSDGVIELNNRYENLPRGTQDEISYMYQFMFSPPGEKSDIVFTNGTHLVTYQFTKLGEELLQTKLGEIRTIHLIKDGEEKIELWLALDYQFIPIKIRTTHKDGSYTEQTASKLSTTLNQPEAN